MASKQAYNSMTDILLSLGSNLEPEAEARRVLESACAELSALLTEAVASSLYATPAEGLHAHGTYVNCVMRARTAFDEAALETAFKQMEARYGRTPADKLTGRVPLDVDLVQWGERIVRPKNWQMNFMRRGLEELGTKN